MFQKYALHFEPYGVLLFLLIMLPNFIWFFLPAPNDVLRADSATGALDAVASVCQILMVAALSVFRNKASKKLRLTPLLLLTAGCCLLYFLCWIVYYAGIVTPLVILGLTLPPCLAFFFFALDRSNGLALLPISVFSVCHLIYAVVNFLLG